MASYPTAVKSFTTKNAGDTIQPADVNDLQDEVNAIEAGLLNGTAPLNSSNSTMVHLSVTAGMNIVGNSTLASTVTIGTLPYIFPATGGSTGQSLVIASTNGSTMTLAWQTAVSYLNLLTTSDAESTTASSAVTNLKNITGLSVPATSMLDVYWTFRKAAEGTADVARMRMQVNNTTLLSATNVTNSTTGSIIGFIHARVSPRSANNPALGFGQSVSNDVGATDIILPNVTNSASTVTGVISSIQLDGYNLNGQASIGISNVKVYEIKGA